ncbi:MAG TPA: Sir2 family NAD-dependent protein deacetylase [Planktothrix sp.]
MKIFEETPQKIIDAAARAIECAKTLIITAGAGMGVDSGLPDFRGDQGFWNAYPLYERLGLRFTELAAPRYFMQDPEFAWGFYGHRANLYRDAVPHVGFSILKSWHETRGLASFVITSNVDGQFHKAGFDPDNIVEVHGSIHHMQCLEPCCLEIWQNDQSLEIDLATMRSLTIPTCNGCGSAARPNVLMFADWSWIPSRTDKQQERLDRFLRECPQPMVIVELGAGRAVPTIRRTSECLAKKYGAVLVRINPREPDVPHPHISIANGAAATLIRINDALQG